ncbi:MAG: DUF3048 domain-containing protein [Anaerolineales bacterium]
MSTSHLKLYLIIIWAMVAAVLLVGLALWGLTNLPTAQPASETPTPTLSPSPTVPPTPALAPTIMIIRATPRPGGAIELPPTWTPITPQAMFDASEAPPGVDPLTGLKVDDPSRLERRPIAVKVSNFPRSLRPYQSGLTKADVVYEYYIEDGLSRFIAVYYGQDAERAGPVRSGRYFDENIMRMYHSALVFADADDRVRSYLLGKADLRNLLFLPRDDNCPPLCRDKTIPSTAGGGYNNVFVNTAGVGAFINNAKQKLRPTFFNTLFHLIPTAPVSRVYTRYSAYSYNYWEYDETQKKYLRYSDANDALNGQGEVYAPHIDQLTNQQLAADNVVVLVVPHLFKNGFDRADQLFDIQMIGSGEAYAFIDGQMYQVLWKRDQLDQPIQLVDAGNNPLSLKPGETYYEVIDPESSARLDGVTMTFIFSIPPRVLTATPRPRKPTLTPNTHK